MEDNKFGKTSQLFLKAVGKNGRTVLEDVSFTAPFKVMQPFKASNGGLKVMYLSASAGMMEGDTQELKILINPGANMELLSQAYEKIHKMKDGCALRTTSIDIRKNACFRYCPQPSIPFRDSAFRSQTRIVLEDQTSHFVMSEILTCGRYASQERFEYRFFMNLTEIYRANTLIYRDNTRYFPQINQMDGMGMYESYYHLGNLFLTGADMQKPEVFIQEVNEILAQEHLEGGISRLADGDFSLRILGRRAQLLEEMSKEIITCWSQHVSSSNEVKSAN